ncbi:YitT family protein [uncultured Jatrophihabitans sp.]|uniref:membrane protein YczE n=1 Tax=uncultured Jatrophihabitans sp. TaxID=1610747 RepID=UPI0035CA2ED1
MASSPLSVLLPIPRDRRAIRAIALVVGLALYGVSMALMLLAGLGLAPWGVLDQGLARTVGGSVGTWSMINGAVVLLLWIPLRQRPGIGTLCNVVLVGTAINLTLWALPTPTAFGTRIAVLAAGIALNAVATALYVGAALGPGPRDGLMTGLAARGHPVRVVRTTIEVAVLLVGWLLDGDVGWGTLAYAVTIGVLLHTLLPRFSIRSLPVPHDTVADETHGPGSRPNGLRVR